MIVSRKTREAFAGGSAIRRMFDEGLRLKAAHGADNVADLSIGNPEFPPPEGFTAALRRVARLDRPHAYMPNAGYPAVRARVAEDLDRRGLLPGVQARHVVMTTGAAGALNVVLKTVLEPGDEVIVCRPYFVEYGFYIENHGGRMVLVETRPDFGVDAGAVAAAIGERTRAVIVNSPNNPSGRLYGERELDDLALALGEASSRFRRPILLLSDEPYREILFDEARFVSPASRYPNSVICYSWSKSFSLSGERIGYAAVNPALEIAEWDLFLESLAMCNRILGFVNAPAFMQHVIAEALGTEPDIAHYVTKRRLLCDALDGAGFEYARPAGTFYFFPRAPGGEASFVARARERLLLVVPGSAFGRKDYFRISFAAPEPTVRLACRRLSELA